MAELTPLAQYGLVGVALGALALMAWIASNRPSDPSADLVRRNTEAITRLTSTIDQQGKVMERIMDRMEHIVELIVSRDRGGGSN